MAAWFLLGLLLLGGSLWLAYAFTRASPQQLAQGLRAFIAGFSMLAGTGLLFTGRLGLALITLGAAVMAARAMKRAPGGFTGAFGHGGGAAPQTSTVTTDTLSMQLDRGTGEVEGDVLKGPFAGRSLASLGISDLLSLLAWCQREDPRSVALLETYLERREPEWRDRATEGGGSAAADGGLDEATAWSILGLQPGAGPDEIKAAHRRLMNQVHPDHGGSGYLAAQINQAKDLLLRRSR